MHWFCRLFFVGLMILSGCGTVVSRGSGQTGERLGEIAVELVVLSEDDQRWEQMVIQGEAPEDVEERKAFFAEKSRLMVERGERCEAIFEEVGFPDYEMVGKEASDAFWIIVQHCDHDPDFQERVVVAMRSVVEREAADGVKLAYLTDRVLVNSGRAQMYGTQLGYEFELARAFPKNSIDEVEGVGARREEVGLEPLVVYMNSMSELFFIMNEERLRENGVEGAYVYPEGFGDW